jgi:hypothetical protein
MKIISILICCIVISSCSKSKDSGNNKCYQCEAISQGNFYKEKVCTSGDPYKDLPKQDAGGNLGWICTEQ